MNLETKEDFDAFMGKLRDTLADAVGEMESPYRELFLIYGSVFQNIKQEGDIPDMFFDIVGSTIFMQASEIQRLKEDIKKLENLIGNYL